MNRALAEISTKLWEVFRAAGFKTKVSCSLRTDSRYVRVENGPVIRVSDHRVTGEKMFDEEIIVWPDDDPKEKMAEAMRLAQRLLGASSSAAV